MSVEVNFKQNSYGNIQRIGATQNGRAVYRVIDSRGDEAGKLTVAGSDVDKFEKAYKDIMETAPKIQKFVVNHSSEEDIKKRKNLSRGIVAAGGVLGAAVPIYLTRKSPSVLKQILATVAGIVTGLSAGFAGSIAATTPPGSIKFAKAAKTLSKVDVQPIVENR